MADPARPSSVGAEILVRPVSGPPGSTVHIRGRRFHNSGYCHSVVISFTDAQGVYTQLGSSYFNYNGEFRTTANIPTGAAAGSGYVMARALVLVGRVCMLWFGGGATATFTVV